ncbi:MAG: GerMN domain-containing protein [Oscillospiraceae bacterium]|nr:GerMN domain-containing protein [Oscillospiraceae bacterium]
MKRRLIPIVAVLSILACACTSNSVAVPSSSSFSVYRVISSDYRTGSDLLQSESVVITDDEELVSQAADALSKQPEDARLQSPLSSGVRLIDAVRKGNVAAVSVSSAYLDLSGMDKTIMDACITLTMCSIEGIDFVDICVGDEAIEKSLTAENFLLFDNIISPGKAQIRIYFPKTSEKALGSEYRTISFDDENSAERKILDAIFEGPTGDNLKRAFPIGTIVMSVYTLDGVCSVSLSGVTPDDGSMSPYDAKLAVYSVVNSLTSLSGIKSVYILIDGKETQYLWGYDISRPLTRNDSIIGSTVTG